MRAADHAWLAMAAGIILYECTAREDELLSEGWDRYMVKNPVLATATPFFVAGHLTNLLPVWADPIAQVFRFVKWISARKQP